MKNFKNNNTFLLLSIFFVIIMLLIFIFVTFSNKSLNLLPQKPVEFTPDQDIDKPEPENIESIINIKDKTPYNGKHFNFNFDQNEGIYYVYFDPNNREAGISEFENFLKSNGINGISYFQGLEESKTPLPTPESL